MTNTQAAQLALVGQHPKFSLSHRSTNNPLSHKLQAPQRRVQSTRMESTITIKKAVERPNQLLMKGSSQTNNFNSNKTNAMQISSNRCMSLMLKIRKQMYLHKWLRYQTKRLLLLLQMIKTQSQPKLQKRWTIMYIRIRTLESHKTEWVSPRPWRIFLANLPRSFVTFYNAEIVP